jgi:hypothetical protein
MHPTASATVLAAACLGNAITNRNNHISVTLQKAAEASTATDTVANVLRTTFLCCKHICIVSTLKKRYCKMPATALATILALACLSDAITNKNTPTCVTLQKEAEASTVADAVADVLRTTFLCCKYISNVFTLMKSCCKNANHSVSDCTCHGLPRQCNKTILFV